MKQLSFTQREERKNIYISNWKFPRWKCEYNWIIRLLKKIASFFFINQSSVSDFCLFEWMSPILKWIPSKDVENRENESGL